MFSLFSPATHDTQLYIEHVQKPSDTVVDHFFQRLRAGIERWHRRDNDGCQFGQF